MIDPPKAAAHDSGIPADLLTFMTQSWASPTGTVPTLAGRERFAERRRKIAAQFPGDVLVVPTGHEKVRANDTNFRFRPGTDFYYLTGIHEPDCVLVILPEGDGHRSIVFTEPNPGKTNTTFFTDRSKGELWVGPRLGVAATAARFGVESQPDRRPLLVHQHHGVRSAPCASCAASMRKPSASRSRASRNDSAFAAGLSELRLIKDDLEVAELRAAIAATKRGFDDVVRALPTAVTERVVEGRVRPARTRGRQRRRATARLRRRDPMRAFFIGCATIAASAAMTCLLLDAGVEAVSLYTADVTRTIPVSGTYTPAQREIYTLVWEAQRAAFAACKPGNDFLDPNTAAMDVLAHGLERLGILSSAEEALRNDKLFYKRYSLHNVSHMLGLDVHDCAAARAETYKFGKLEPGMVLTVEPGLYFQLDDLTVPEPYRGIGVRIEDDIVITADGYENLSAALPSEPDAVENWVRSLAGTMPEAWVIPSAE